MMLFKKRYTTIGLNKLFKKRVNIALPFKKKLKNNYTTFIHCAAEIKQASKMQATNVIGTRNCLDFCIQNKILNFIFISSIHVGRKQETNKSKENAFLHYLQTKKKAEELVKREKDNFRNTTVARISSPIGKKTRPNQILLALVERAKKNMPLILWGNPNRMGNYLYLKDLGAIIPELIKKRGHAIYTIRNKCNISDYSLAYLIKCKLKSKSKICVKKKYFSKILKKTHEVKWGRAGKTNIRKIILNVAKNKY